MAQGKQWTPDQSLKNLIKVAKGAGVKIDEIAEALGVSKNTLKKHCQAELSAAKAWTKMQVRGSLFQAVMKDRNVRAIELWLRLVEGWRPDAVQMETPDIHLHFGELGEPGFEELPGFNDEPGAESDELH